eukprot:g5493.t1
MFLGSLRHCSSFIDKAKALGANSLLGAFTHANRFDGNLKDLEIKKIGSGFVECKLSLVDETLLNSYGTLHGGATSLIVDVVGTLALLTINPTKPGVSVEMNTSFLSAAKSGSEIKIVGKVLKSGKKLGFTEVVLESEDRIIATGRHTKAL